MPQKKSVFKFFTFSEYIYFMHSVYEDTRGRGQELKFVLVQKSVLSLNFFLVGIFFFNFLILVVCFAEHSGTQWKKFSVSWCPFFSYLLEEGMATYSSSLAWRISWTEEPGGLQSIVLQWIRHDWATNTACNYHLVSFIARHFFFAFVFVWLLFSFPSLLLL